MFGLRADHPLLNPNKRVISRAMHADNMAARHDIACYLAVNTAVASMHTPNLHAHEHAWRNSLPFEHAMARCRNPNTRGPTVGVFSSGGCLDTLAALRSGFRPIWGTEVDERMRTLWSSLTGTPDLGDTFGVDWGNQSTPDLLIAGQPCTDYSASGKKKGDEGETGWMFCEQATPILTLEPNSFVLEMVSNALHVHKGRALRKLLNRLHRMYVIKLKVIRTIEHGDGTNRTRLFIVGFHKRMGRAAYMFRFPKGEAQPQPARSYAVPDAYVPDKYWRDLTHVHMLSKRPTMAGRLHKIAQIGHGMGHSSMPHAIYSWDGIFNCQTTYNGGGMRPPLEWRSGQRLTRARLTTPLECVRLASLPDTYLDAIREIDDDDSFVFKCVNMGVPLRTAHDIYNNVKEVLEVYSNMNADTTEYTLGGSANSARDPSPCITDTYRYCEQHRVCMASEITALNTSIGDKPCSEGLSDVVRSMLVDSGCDHTLGFTDLDPSLRDRKRARCKIQVASKDTIDAKSVGTLNAYALNTAQHEGMAGNARFQCEVMTVPNLSKELFSIDSFYRDQGYSIHLRQPPDWSGMEKGGHKVPFRYDWSDSGFYLDYIPIPPEHSRYDSDSLNKAKSAYNALLEHEHNDRLEGKSKSNAALLRCHCYSNKVAKRVHDRCDKDPCVTETIVCEELQPDPDTPCLPKGTCVKEGALHTLGASESLIARHPDDRELRGVREGLKTIKRKQPLSCFHNDHGHIGECPGGCHICDMVKGAMRRINKRADVIRDRRIGYSWSLDMVVMSDRSIEKHKYLCVLRDRSWARYTKLIPLQYKSDAAREIRKWIQSLREDPIYHKLGYDMVTHIKTDHDGAWDHDCAQWQDMICANKTDGGLGVRMEYISKDRHEQNPAERHVGIAECVIKSLLMERNLPPNWWSRAAADAEFLLNRFPPISTDAAIPIDGDRYRPIELFTDGFYSRRQCDRELNYYVPVGTPCLVHDTRVKGSGLAPKVRWGVACGMQRETPYFVCPFLKTKFHGKSYTAYKLRAGLNYAQFLGLPSLESTQRSLVIPGDLEIDERIVLQLPKMVEAPRRDSLPIRLYQPPSVEEGDEGLDELLDAEVTASKDNSLILAVTDGLGTPEDAHVGAPRPDECTPSNSDDRPTLEVEGLGGVTQDSKTKSSGPVTPNLEVGSPNSKRGRVSNDPRLSTEIRISNDLNARTDYPLPSSEKEAVNRIREALHGDPFKDNPKADPELDSKQHESEVEAPQDGEVDLYDKDMFCQIELMDENLWDQAEADMYKGDTVTSEEGDTFHRIVRKLKGAIHPDHEELYRQWLLNHSPTASELTEDMIPLGRGQIVEAGISFPRPTGHNWRCMLEQHELDTGHHGGDPMPAVRHALHVTTKWLRSLKNKPITAHKTKRTKAIESGLKEAPKTLNRAWRGDDALEWVKASDLEMDTLTEMGVFDHGYTKQQLIDLNICDKDFKVKKPINLSIVLDHKYTDGVLTRYKVRMAVAGHKYNLKKGIHYNEVFAAAPNQNTARVMCALTTAMGLYRKSWDIKLAYCWADLPKDQLIALQYPQGYERYDDNGEPLYIVLRKNCYGIPNAGRIWSQHRDQWINEYFNKGGYRCHRCTYDPCLFYITRGHRTIDPSSTSKDRRPANEEAWVSIHTDDCDAYGTSKSLLNDIYKAMAKQWSAKEVDPNFMLGVKREARLTPNGKSVTMTMEAYVKGMVEAFRDNIPACNPPTPFPPGKKLWKSKNPDPAEVKEVLDLGYQRAVGMLLWAQRGVYPECTYGVNQLCRFMSSPTREAWDAAMHMMAWMRTNANKGIRFHDNGNLEPIVFSDAAFDPDPQDGLSQYGFCTMWMGGPIATSSKKLAHVGLSSFHNEYMALRHASADALWLRNLLREIGLQCFITSPTVIFGDNDAANKLTSEDFISTGNKYIYTQYHWVKELVREMEVKVLPKRTKLNLADLFTKPCPREVFQALGDKLKGYIGWE